MTGPCDPNGLVGKNCRCRFSTAHCNAESVLDNDVEQFLSLVECNLRADMRTCWRRQRPSKQDATPGKQPVQYHILFKGNGQCFCREPATC